MAIGSETSKNFREIVCGLEKCNYFCIRFIGQPLGAYRKGWRVRISASTQDFHSCKMSSTLIRATK